MHIDTLESRRLFAAGQIDTSFGGGDGAVELQLYSPTYNNPDVDSTVDGQGRTIVAAFYGSKRQIRVGRFTADGRVDATFDGDGVAKVSYEKDVLQRYGENLQVAVDHKGRVLVMSNRILTRLTPGGAVDTKFGTNGTVTLPVLARGVDLTVDSRNRPVIVGTSTGKTGTRAAVIRLGERGVLDTGFGSGGAYKTPVPQDAKLKEPGNASGIAVKVLPNGQIFGVGEVRYTYSRETSNMIRHGTSLFLLNANGSLDPKYGTAGTTTVTNDGTDVSTATASFVSFDAGAGAILRKEAYINDDPDGEYRGGVDWLRVDAKGKVDREGFTLAPKALGDQRPARRGVSVIGVQPNGTLLVSSGTLLYRLKSNFQLDPTFTPVATNARHAFARGNETLITTYVRLYDDGVFSVKSITLA